MSKLSEQVISDLSLLFEDFSETVTIDGKKIEVVVDRDKLQERSQKEFDGIYVGDLLYFVNKNDLIREPSVGDIQRLNKRIYEVIDVRLDLGLYEIILKVADN